MTIDELIARKKALGYTNEQIAQLSGVPFGTVQKIFGRQTSSPRADTLRKLESVLFGRLYSFSTQQYVGEYLGEPPMIYGTSALDGRYSNNNEEDGEWSNEGVIARAYMPHKKQGEYTVDDVQLIPSDIRFELIDGYIIDVGTPSLEHQTLLEEINSQIDQFIRENHGECLSFITPLPVITDDNYKTEVHPDLIIKCPKEDNDGHYVFNETIPNFIIEVLSPSTKRFDTHIKLKKYMRDGVKEYWVIDLLRRDVTVHSLNGPLRLYTFDDAIPVNIYDGKLQIDMLAAEKRIAKAKKLFNYK